MNFISYRNSEIIAEVKRFKKKRTSKNIQEQSLSNKVRVCTKVWQL